MQNKRALQEALIPTAVLKPLTADAERAIPDGMIMGGVVPIRRFPFRVGRESRVVLVNGQLRRLERPRSLEHEPNNDLYLLDTLQPLRISREHFQIERTPEGYKLQDRGSACGVRVAGVEVGGNDRGGEIPLQDGDEIAISIYDTPYLFTFITLEDAAT